MNYFELFEIPVAPVVERGGLSRKYFDLQKKYHPDYFADAGDVEREEVMRLSADINKAFRIFQQPDLTLEYFLQLRGVLTPDEKYQLPNSFLMEVMELNEDFDGDPAKVEAFKSDIQLPVVTLLSATPDRSYSTAELELLKEYYFKKKYLERILDRIAD